MARSGYFQDFLSSILTRTPRLHNLRSDQISTDSLAKLASDVLNTRGEASALVLAEQLLERYTKSTEEEKTTFFFMLLNDFDLDAQALATATAGYAEEKTSEQYDKVIKAFQSRRQSLFKRLLASQQGTYALVKMRDHLRKATKKHPELKAVDIDLIHLFKSWFNRGFLVMQPIDWSTPAHILEKIIAYEAVHQIHSWGELRRRLEPSDRRCYAFFHLAMPDEPLIFVEVALTDKIADNIGDLLSADRDPIAAENASAAIFYSISNCQAGLAGISFGNFLIKQVAKDLQLDLPNVQDFATLSPIPGFTQWLKSTDKLNEKQRIHLIELLNDSEWINDEAKVKYLNEQLEPLAATYLAKQKMPNGQALDPVLALVAVIAVEDRLVATSLETIGLLLHEQTHATPAMPCWACFLLDSMRWQCRLGAPLVVDSLVHRFCTSRHGPS